MSTSNTSLGEAEVESWFCVTKADGSSRRFYAVRGGATDEIDETEYNELEGHN